MYKRQVIIRHEDGDTEDGFGIEIYHHPLDDMNKDDLLFYTLLTRGMAYQATIDTEAILEFGEESLIEGDDIVTTEH